MVSPAAASSEVTLVQYEVVLSASIACNQSVQLGEQRAVALARILRERLPVLRQVIKKRVDAFLIEFLQYAP